MSATVVLVSGVVAALVAAVVATDRRGGRPAPTATSASPSAGAGDALEPLAPLEVASAALDRVEAIEHPLDVWLRLADCESGEWDANADPMPGSARWWYGTRITGESFEGGLHFAPETWEAYRFPGMPGHAGEAMPVSQILVAEQVQDDQGWRAWPVCSQMIGVRPS